MPRRPACVRKAIIYGHARLPNQTRVCRCVCGGFARPRRRVDAGLSLAGVRSLRSGLPMRTGDAANSADMAYGLSGLGWDLAEYKFIRRQQMLHETKANA